MKNEFTSAMRRATELVRAGDPAAATRMIQSSLKGAAAPEFTSPAIARLPHLPATVKKRGLRATLATLMAAKPTHGFARNSAADPVLPEGARFDSGTFTATSGSRDYRVFIPNKTAGAPKGLIMMLHGCTQNPVDFANGTDMNRLAQENGFIVVYPAQSQMANMQSCWNWFAPSDQGRDAGEPAILAGLAQQLQREHNIPEGKVFVAGLSAGAAMAVILGRAYPDLFTGVGAHSGLPYKSATDLHSALAVMAGTVHLVQQPALVPVPTIVFHGTADHVVNQTNSQRIFQDATGSGTDVIDDGTINGRSFSRTTIAGGEARVEYWRIDGLGHAWSGGKAAGSYTDAKGPDASAEMVRFFLDISVKGQ